MLGRSGVREEPRTKKRTLNHVTANHVTALAQSVLHQTHAQALGEYPGRTHLNLYTRGKWYSKEILFTREK